MYFEQVKSVDEIKSIFLKKTDYYFSYKELKFVEHKNKIKSLGARYMIKKAVLDFLNLNDNYRDIEIENEPDGKPIIRFSGKVKKRAEENGIKNTQISISHSRNYVASLVIIE